MGTAAPGGGGGMNGDEVVEGEKLWSNLWSSTNTLRESALRWRWFSSALVLCVWSYCDIHYTADSDLSIGPVVLAWLVIPVEDIASDIGQGCFANLNASRIHLRLTTISLSTTTSTIKIILRMPTQYFKNFADNTQTRLVGTEIANVGRHRQRIPQPR